MKISRRILPTQPILTVMGQVNHTLLNDWRAAFSELYEEALPTVYGFVRLRVGTSAVAEDITAETFAAALARFQEGTADEVTISWLRMVAKRRLIDLWRRESVASDKVVVLAGSLRSRHEPSAEERGRVMQVLDDLDSSHRAVLVMQHIEGYTVNEIAEVIGRSPKATESLLTRARNAFRETYREGERG